MGKACLPTEGETHGPRAHRQGHRIVREEKAHTNFKKPDLGINVYGQHKRIYSFHGRNFNPVFHGWGIKSFTKHSG